MKAWLLLIFLLAFAGCGNDWDKGRLSLHPGLLPTQSFTIFTGRDTVTALSGGTQIQIPAGAIKAVAASVRLELKEALTVEQMVTGGLFTQTSKNILSSGGMVYIGLAQGEEGSIAKPLRARVPARGATSGMSLFKGEEKDGKIVWQDPAPLSTSRSPELDSGAALFAANCASCHHAFKDATGPSLYGVLERWESKKEMYAFTRAPAKMIAEGHPYANCIYESWGRTRMTAFPQLTDRELDLIYAWANADGRKNLGRDTAARLRSSRDSCRHRKAMLDIYEAALAQAEAQRRPTVRVDVRLPGANSSTSNGAPCKRGRQSDSGI